MYLSFNKYLCIHSFKLNDLDQEGAFFAFRIEGDQNSIKERIKDISNEMNLKIDQQE